MNDKLLDLQVGHIIEACFHILFHLVDVICLWAQAVAEFCCSPVLLYEVHFTVVLQIEVTDMTPGGYQLFQVRLLVDEISLCE